MPWLHLVVADCVVLQSCLPDILGELPPADVNFEPWWRLCSDHPCEWKKTVSKYHTHLDDIDVVRKAPRRGCTAFATIFRCDLCEHAAFESLKALDQHKRVKHKIRTQVADYVGNTSKCPICRTDFGNRLRLISHLSERRIRSKVRKTNCQIEFLKQQPSKLSEEQLATLHAENAKARKAAMKDGHTHVIAVTPAKRDAPSVLKKVREVRPRRRLRGKQFPPPDFYMQRPAKRARSL